ITFASLIIVTWKYLFYQHLRKNNAEAQPAGSKATLALDQERATLTTHRLPSLYPPQIDEPLSVTENTTRELINRNVSGIPTSTVTGYGNRSGGGEMVCRTHRHYRAPRLV